MKGRFLRLTTSASSTTMTTVAPAPYQSHVVHSGVVTVLRTEHPRPGGRRRRTPRCAPPAAAPASDRRRSPSRGPSHAYGARTPRPDRDVAPRDCPRARDRTGGDGASRRAGNVVEETGPSPAR